MSDENQQKYTKKVDWFDNFLHFACIPLRCTKGKQENYYEECYETTKGKFYKQALSSNLPSTIIGLIVSPVFGPISLICNCMDKTNKSRD